MLTLLADSYNVILLSSTERYLFYWNQGEARLSGSNKSGIIELKLGCAIQRLMMGDNLTVVYKNKY